MKLNPVRNKHVGKNILRGRMMTEIYESPRGKRLLKECQAALDRPANQDEDSRNLVLNDYATRMDIFPFELEDLLNRPQG